jgi:cytidylate kinase
MLDNKSITIISGPVGAGKTTVAKQLVAISTGLVAYIEGDTFWGFIAKTSVNNSRNKNFKMIMTAMTAAAMSYALYGYAVILDFSIPPWFLETAIKMGKLRDIELDYIVIKPSVEICAVRAATRTEGIITDYTIYRELYMSFDEAARYTISDDAATEPELAKRIKEGVAQGKFRIKGGL